MTKLKKYCYTNRTKAQARFQSSKDYYERINSASKSDGVIAASELQKTHDQVMADESEYKAGLYSAASYRQMGNYLAVVAPYTGIITRRNIDQGSFVGNANEQRAVIFLSCRMGRKMFLAYHS